MFVQLPWWMLDRVEPPPVAPWWDDASPDLRTDLVPLVRDAGLPLDVRQQLGISKAFRLAYLRRSNGWGRSS